MNCAIEVHQLGENRYRARAAMFPDCEAEAATPEAAEEAVRLAIESILHERGKHDLLNPIDRTFLQLKERNQKAFMPFLAAGDPDMAATEKLLTVLAESGANLIEVGFPYSDPIADGPVIQASYTRALTKGARLDDIFAMLSRVKDTAPFAGHAVPLVGMCAYALIHRRGPGRFLSDAHEAGLSGLIVPDLPLEEAEEMARLAAAADMKLIHLVTPTTPRERAAKIAALSTGFLYYVSVAGITGERDRLPEGLLTEIEWLRGRTALPICVGFGISKPEQVHTLKPVADGIIVGSALVRMLEVAGKRSIEDIGRDMGALAHALAEALR